METVKVTKGNLKEVVLKAARVLKNDGVVVFPSDTVYGLGVNAQSHTAVEKLFRIKDRPQGKAISIAVSDIESFKKYVHLQKNQEAILQALLPGPFTVVLPSKQTVCPAIEAEDKSLGVRLPQNDFMNALSKELPFPYTATSANITGKGPHYSINAFLKTLSAKKMALVDLIIDAGELPHNKPSTVLNLQKDKVEVIRKGSFTIHEQSKYYSTSPDETKKIAKEILASVSANPLVILLKGDLGAGKTVFAQGIGQALGITEHIVSPTYVYYYEYTTPNKLFTKLHHFDLYRAQSVADLKALSINSYLKKGNLTVIEWGERLGGIENIFKKSGAFVLFVTITENGENNRSIVAYKLEWTH